VDTTVITGGRCASAPFFRSKPPAVRTAGVSVAFDWPIASASPTLSKIIVCCLCVSNLYARVTKNQGGALCLNGVLPMVTARLELLMNIAKYGIIRQEIDGIYRLHVENLDYVYLD